MNPLNVAMFAAGAAGAKAKDARIAELEEALTAVVQDVNEYERINNLRPNPGRSECWDSVARAKAVLEKR